MDIRSAEVNGTKSKSLRYRHVKRACKQKKSRARKLPLLSSQFVYIGVLSDDFATVDVREDYANLSLTEKANSRGVMNGKNQ